MARTTPTWFALLGLPLGFALGACAVVPDEDEPCAEIESSLDAGACFEQRATFELAGREPCGAALGGYVLLCDASTDQVMLGRIGPDDALETLATIDVDPGFPTRAELAVEPERDELWVVDITGQLHRFDRDGQLLATTPLGPELASSRELDTHEGDVIRTLSVVVGNFVTADRIERRGPDDTLRWSLDLDALAIEDFEVEGVYEGGIYDAAVRGSTLSFLAYDFGFDSAAIELVALDPATGSMLWHRRLVNDDFDGPRFGLTGDDELILATLHGDEWDESGPEPVQLAPAFVEVEGIDDEGETTWTRTHELPLGHRSVHRIWAARAGSDVVAQIATTAEGGEVSLVRLPAEGDSCELLLNTAEYGIGNQGLAAIGGGRLIAGVPVTMGADEPEQLLVFGDGVGGCVDLP